MIRLGSGIAAIPQAESFLLGDAKRVWQEGRVNWLKPLLPIGSQPEESITDERAGTGRSKLRPGLENGHRYFQSASSWLRIPCGHRFNLAVLVAIGLMASACSHKVPEMPHHGRISPISVSLRVATYNVFSGTRDADSTAGAIRRMSADVLLLQELSPEGAGLLDKALEMDYPYRHFSGGVAVMSRWPLRNPRYERSRDGINGYLVAEIVSPGGRFQVASLHLDPLRMWTTRDKWTLPSQLLWGQDDVHRKELEQIVRTLRPGMPTVLGGDFNSVSGAAVRRLQDLGYKDSFATVNKRPDQSPTIRFELFGFPTGRRIDYILHDSSFQTIQSTVFHGAPSDHDAVVSVLVWK